jgi:hypothetical protein
MVEGSPIFLPQLCQFRSGRSTDSREGSHGMMSERKEMICILFCSLYLSQYLLCVRYFVVYDLNSLLIQ